MSRVIVPLCGVDGLTVPVGETWVFLGFRFTEAGPAVEFESHVGLSDAEIAELEERCAASRGQS